MAGLEAWQESGRALCGEIESPVVNTMRRSCPRASRPRHLCRMFRNRDPLRRRPMAAVSVERLVQELEKLKQQMDAGALKAGDYHQRLPRVIRELRERKLDADRPAIAAALADALRRGVITPAVQTHIEKPLGAPPPAPRTPPTPRSRDPARSSPPRPPHA